MAENTQSVHVRLINIKSIGDNNMGSYAKTDISKGTCVLAEAPLLTSSTGADDDILRSFSSIPETQQMAYLKLCCIPPTVKDWDAAGVLNRQIAAIYNTNVFHSGEVYNQASRFNHSCCPNLNHIVRGGKRLFYARRDIRDDEELTISYIDESFSLEKRKLQLLQWLFDCQCVACDGSLESIQMEQKRLEIRRVELKTNAYTDALSNSLSLDPPSDYQMLELLALHDKKIQLLNELSIRPWELSQSYAKASKCCVMLCDQEKAVEYKRQQMEVLRANFGEEDDGLKKVSVEFEELRG
ncbi:hypothetical protein E2P81_ATG06122 [Venturia nashicola]|nr:hypothetical protein E2P81_ATG06122 [Venturia nashicola]